MGKRKELEDEGESPQSHKKHKKHKKKHKKNKGYDFDDTDDAPKPAIKLKLKIGGISLGTKSITKTEIKGATSEIRLVSDDDETHVEPVKAPVSKKAPKVEADEESRWLKALEKGDLDDNGDLKKEKDPALMTARQRSLMQGKKEKAAMQAMYPGYKIIELTEEQIKRKEKRAMKRKEQALEKRETEKKQTIERLLKKQDTKGKGIKAKSSKKSDVPRYRYVNKKDSISVSVPIGYIYPMAKYDPLPPVKPRDNCGVEGCSNLKKYSCSKTGIPLCSLACYKKNLEHSQRTV